MALFIFEVTDGRTRQGGEIRAQTRQEAAAQLRSEGLTILSLREAAGGEASVGSGKASGIGLGARRFLAGYLTHPYHIENVLRQLSVLLNARVPLVRGLEVLRDYTPGLLSRCLSSVVRRVRGGAALSEAVRSEAPFFGRVNIGLIVAGEANGKLNEMCALAAELMERRRLIVTRITQILTYPAIVIIATFAVGRYLMLELVPAVLRVIEERQAPIPLVTRMLIRFVDFMRDYGLYCMLIPFALAAAYALARRNDSSAKWVDRWKLAVPLLGKVFRESSNALFFRTLSMLLREGIPLVNALGLAAEVQTNRYYRSLVYRLIELIRHGQSFAAGIVKTAIGDLCPMSRVMVATGEETGTLDENLLQTARLSEEHFDRRVVLLCRLFEPAVILCIASFVFFLYLAFFLGVWAAIGEITRMGRFR